ncbi:MAG: hypothetical protein C0616_09670 [Desulfuromonas sp.]|nr:MAG: hypothetical protein C0616_09670 [Desulfuromonas sp.]
MAAFRSAEAAGADGFECDIQLTADAVPILLHDDNIRRTSTGRGKICDLTLAEVRQSDFGGWFSELFRGEPLPTLAELLSWTGSRLWLNLELKHAETAMPTLELLRQFPGSKVVLSSFDWDLLYDLRLHAPGLPLAVLVDRKPIEAALDTVRRLGASALHPSIRRISPQFLAACRREKVPVFPYTVDDPMQFSRLVQDGVDGVFTNNPRLLNGSRNTPP